MRHAITATEQEALGVRSLALAVALLASCAASHDPCAATRPCVDAAPAFVCVDTQIPPAAYQGIRDWAAVLCDRVRFAILPFDGATPAPAQCRYTVLAALSTYPWVQTDAAGFAEPDRGVAWIVLDRVPPEMLRAVMAHELGHLLGIAADGDGIMRDPLVDACITTDNVRSVP